MKRFIKLTLFAVVCCSLAISPLAHASTYYILATPKSSLANQSTDQAFVDLSVDIFTADSTKLFYTYIICPTITSDGGDFDVLLQNCQSIYLNGFNTTYSYSTSVVTGAKLLYPGPNNLSCVIFSSKDNYSDYQLCNEFSGGSVRINYTGNILPVYRFWSNTKQHHFYTISAPEKTSIINTYNSNVWDYEAVAWNAIRYNNGCSEGQPVYRFWSDTYQGHFFTINSTEKDQIIQKWPTIWKYEGISFCSGTYPDGNLTKPVYRFWSATNRSHFYTTSSEERDQVIQKWPNIWQYEGIAYYVN